MNLCAAVRLRWAFDSPLPTSSSSTGRSTVKSETNPASYPGRHTEPSAGGASTEMRTPMTQPQAAILELRGVNKSFGAVQVLHDVNLSLYPGQVTALVGDNGAGKSTLVKCRAGINSIDSGEYLYEGKAAHVGSPRDAAALGIEIVYQDLALCENLDIVQNMFLGREPKSGIVLDEATMETRARETLASLSVRTISSVRQLVSSLSGGQRQSVAIA